MKNKWRVLSTACALLVICSPAVASSSQSYGDLLLSQVTSGDGNIAGITIETTGKDGKAITVSHGQLGKSDATAPLTDSMGSSIGTIRVHFRNGHGDAQSIAAMLGRRIYLPDNLVDPDPFVPGTARAPRAQAIVEHMIDTHPLLVTLAMHVAPPNGQNIILASNFGRIGKLADSDDQRVIDGAILKEVTNGGDRLAVSLPQTDAAGHVIGALSTSFVVTPTHDSDQAYADALALRDEIARATPSLDALVAQ